MNQTQENKVTKLVTDPARDRLFKLWDVYLDHKERANEIGRKYKEIEQKLTVKEIRKIPVMVKAPDWTVKNNHLVPSETEFVEKEFIISAPTVPQIFAEIGINDVEYEIIASIAEKAKYMYQQEMIAYSQDQVESMVK